MNSMTLKEFTELTGVARSSMDRRLEDIGATPIGCVAVTARYAYKWSVDDLEKAASLVGTHVRRGRPKK